MDINASFVAHAKKHFGVDLPPGEAWSELGLRMIRLLMKEHAPEVFVEQLCDAYDACVQEKPDLESLARPLFFAIVLHGARQPYTHLWTNRIANVVPLWTRNGTKDMSSQEASTLADFLRERLDHGKNAQHQTARMLWASPALWKEMGDYTLHVAGVDAQSIQSDMNHMNDITWLVHRYHPEQTSLSRFQETEAYAKMCGCFQKVKTSLFGMVPILHPLHHNTLAWTMAFNHCEKPASGQWMALAPVLSSLAIKPSDVLSWKIMRLLHDCKANDSSCTDLVDTLCRVHPDMGEAYSNIWPVVNTMFENDTRDLAAVELWQNASLKPGILELPALLV